MTVQETVQSALSVVCDDQVNIACAGRTDSGVHATGQVIHFDVNKPRTDVGLLRGGNSHLPPDVRLLWVGQVPDDFHARFSAQSRSYTYILDTSCQHMPAFQPWTVWYPRPLDLVSIQKGMQILTGEHDFASFQASGCQAPHARRRIIDFHLAQSGPFVYLNVTANAFVYRMVRKMVGALLEVGRGRQPVGWISELLKVPASAETPPHLAKGLHLTHVAYESKSVPQWHQYFNGL